MLQPSPLIDFIFISIQSHIQWDKGQCDKERACIWVDVKSPERLCVNPMLTGLEGDHIVL